MRLSTTRACVGLLFLVLMSLSTGCSVYKASTQPGPADLDGLGMGSRRGDVLSRLGAPAYTEPLADGRRTDLFQFQSGLHQASKVRVVLYLAADVFTLGLAELILWPIELTVLNDSTCTANVGYTKESIVDSWLLTKKNGVQGC